MLQFVWHGKEPVLSVDFQPNSHTLVSGGQDGEVKVRTRALRPNSPTLCSLTEQILNWHSNWLAAVHVGPTVLGSKPSPSPAATGTG